MLFSPKTLINRNKMRHCPHQNQTMPHCMTVFTTAPIVEKNTNHICEATVENPRQYIATHCF